MFKSLSHLKRNCIGHPAEQKSKAKENKKFLLIFLAERGLEKLGETSKCFTCCSFEAAFNVNSDFFAQSGLFNYAKN